MRDDLEVRIESLRAAHERWLEDAAALAAPLENSDWSPWHLTTSPAMPAGLQQLVEQVKTATRRLRESLMNGSLACTEAARAAGKAAGMYQAVEDDAEHMINVVHHDLGQVPR